MSDSGTGSNRVTTAEILITGLGTKATISNFALTTSGTTVAFAGHEAGFGGPGSQYIGGSTPVPTPEPSTLLLAGIGLIGCGLVRFRKRFRWPAPAL